MTVPDETRRRVQALDLRVRIEAVAHDAYFWACPGAPGRERKVKTVARLAFVYQVAGPARIAEAMGVIRLARHVYGRTSDVLHGRVSHLNLPEAVIGEWRAAVEQLELLCDTES